MYNNQDTLQFFDLVFDGNPESYRGIEIQGCAVMYENDGSTSIDVNNHDPHFFSVYLIGNEKAGQHRSECIADFDFCMKAVVYANALSEKYGWPVVNHVVTEMPVTQ